METRTEQLNLRLTSAQVAVLRQAAHSRGESTSDYVLHRAVEAAEVDLADRRVFAASDIPWDALQALIAAQPSRPERLVRLLEEPSILKDDEG